MKSDEIALVKKAQKGNEEAYVELYHRYEEMIYRMAFIYTKNQEDALDIVQETAFKSFKFIRTLREPKFFKTWLIKITITCAIGLLNKRKVTTPVDISQLNNMHFSEDEDILLSLTLQELMDNLAETEKSVILLRYYQDYTLNDIANILDIPLGTAKAILYRTLEKLRGRVKEAGNL